jgi:hypothetical protein
MTLKSEGLRAASAAFGKRLAEEAFAQNAYARHFPDGRISVELEWVELEPIAEAVIEAYMAEVGK